MFEQYIIVFDFITISKKFEIIFCFRFSHIFKNLKHYLKFIERYVQKIEFFQRRKINLFRASSNNKKHQRKIYNQRTILIQSNSKKFVAYEILQIVFSNFIFFIHFDRKRFLFINMNVFKKYNFDIIIYHVKNEIKYRNDLKILMIRIDIKSIFF